MSVLTTEPPVELELQVAQNAPRRFHPGWVILGMSAVIVFMSAPGQSYSVAAFIDPMLGDLGLLRTQYSLAYLVATVLGGLTLPMMGRWLDSFGARKMLPIVALLLGMACLWMGSIHHVAALYLGFAMIRCLGQGTLTLISSWIVGEWFERRRGLATGLVGLGGTLSVMCVPQINNLLIVQFGWRSTWMFLAAAVGALLIIPGIVILRDRPEDMGLLPDGRVPTDLDKSAPVRVTADNSRPKFIQPTQVSWTASEACRTPTFWKLLAVISTCSMIGTGLIFHQVSLLGEHGVTRSNALWLMAVQAVVGTVSSVVAGYLTDRIQARYLLAASMLFISTALALWMWVPSPVIAVVYAGLLGLQGGIIRTTGTVVWINYYGRLYQGAVRGLAMSIMVIAAAFGPLPLALAKDHFGSYQLALGCFLVFPLIAGVAVLTAEPPVKQAEENNERIGA
jgi:MFS family permease